MSEEESWKEVEGEVAEACREMQALADVLVKECNECQQRSRFVGGKEIVKILEAVTEEFKKGVDNG